MDEMENIFLEDHEVLVEWHYFEDDEDMLELGQEYEEAYEVSFKFEEIKYNSQNPKHMFEE